MCRYCKVAYDIVYGKNPWGNAPERWKKLERAGYNWKIVQDIVNAMVGDPTRRCCWYIVLGYWEIKSIQNHK